MFQLIDLTLRLPLARSTTAMSELVLRGMSDLSPICDLVPCEECGKTAP